MTYYLRMRPASSRKLIACIVESADQVWYVPTKCYKHQGHRHTRSGLVLADDFLQACDRHYGYFGALATWVNSWREVGPTVLSIATDIDRFAQEACATLPPRCLTGRWLSIHGTEVAAQKFGKGRAAST